LWLHSLKVAQLLRSGACLHTNQSRSYLNHLVHFWKLEYCTVYTRLIITRPLCRTLFSEVRSVWGGVDKSLARPNSRCRRTESIVSLERRVCSCAELQVFSCYRRWEEPCQATRAIYNNIDTRIVIKFIFLQGKAPKDIHVILKEKLGKNASSYATIKNWVA